MEIVDKKVCLDTDVCIAVLKKDDRIKHFLSHLMKREVAISVVTRFELGLRETRKEEVERFIAGTEVIDFTEAAAKLASDLFMDLKKKGRIVEFRDIFVAATCITQGYVLATMNKKHFIRIPRLEMF